MTSPMSTQRIIHPLIGESDKRRHILFLPIILCLQLAPFILLLLEDRLCASYSLRWSNMLVVLFAFLAISSVSAAPREKRFDVDDGWPYTSWPYTAFAGPYSAFASSGYPFLRPMLMPFPLPYIPVPDWPSTLPWYKGDNVCVETKEMKEPEEMREWMNAGFSTSVDYSHESESCRGSGDIYVCMSRSMSNDELKTIIKKYFCCHGFTRATGGKPGCVENPEKEQADSLAITSSPTQVNLKEHYQYDFIKGNSKSKSGVENVPIQ